jgi:EAL domain-containing protein (putative c-di-GMP-specific phosphodiesterase class I)
VQLVLAVVGPARGLCMRTAAYGVDDAVVLELLEELGLDQVQGPLFAGDVSAAPVTPHAERLP